MPKKSAPDPDLGIILCLLRIVRGWYQRDLAVAAQLPRTSITAYEKGARAPKYQTLERLLSSMGFDLSALEETRAFINRLRRAHGLPSAKDRAEVPALWSRLKLYSPSVQKSLVAEAREFQDWALCEFLCLESAAEGREDARKALELADLALEIALRLPGKSPWGAKVRGYAWAHVGNARRIADDLSGSDEAFRMADEFWKSGRRDRSPFLEEARVLGMKAALRRSQRRLGEALALLEEALRMPTPPALRGMLLVSKAKAVEEFGRYEEAAAILRNAAPAVEATGDPELRFILHHNLMDCLSKAGRIAEAAALLPVVKALVAPIGGTLHELRIRWTHARIMAGQGEEEQAIAALSEVRTAFSRQGSGYDTALVSLELATLYAGAGAFAQVKALARHMVPIFQSKQIHREALAALAVFRQAAEAERITVELVRKVAAFLCQGRHNAELVFEG